VLQEIHLPVVLPLATFPLAPPLLMQKSVKRLADVIDTAPAPLTSEREAEVREIGLYLQHDSGCRRRYLRHACRAVAGDELLCWAAARALKG
jgi:hypothetical protein